MANCNNSNPESEQTKRADWKSKTNHFTIHVKNKFSDLFEKTYKPQIRCRNFSKPNCVQRKKRNHQKCFRYKDIRRKNNKQYNMELRDAFLGLISKNFSLKKFLKNTCSEKVSYIFSKKSFSNLQETELSYIFFKNVFLIFWEGYIQNPRHILNPGIFKSQDIFRTLPKIYIQRFAKIAT